MENPDAVEGPKRSFVELGSMLHQSSIPFYDMLIMI
jgi:hypothetical protein